MFLKRSTRRKNGNIHRSWSVVESRRIGRRGVQQRAFWEQAVSVFDETNGQCRQLFLIPEGRPISAAEVDTLLCG